MKRKQLTIKDAVEMVKREVDATRQADFAAKAGVSQQYISDILSGQRRPGQKILDALGLRKVVTYEVKE